MRIREMHEGNRSAVCQTNFVPAQSRWVTSALAFASPINVGHCAVQCVCGSRFDSVGKKLVSQSLTLQKPSARFDITRAFHAGQDMNPASNIEASKVTKDHPQQAFDTPEIKIFLC
jgi:hypothetical protein